MLAYTLLLAFNPFTAFDVPPIVLRFAMAAGYLLCAVYAGLAWRLKRRAAMTVNLSVFVMLAVALVWLLD